MYFDDHAPPHCHAKYNEHQFVMEVQRLEVLEGRLPRRALSLVLDWAEMHRTELLTDWDLCRAKLRPLSIAHWSKNYALECCFGQAGFGVGHRNRS